MIKVPISEKKRLEWLEIVKKCELEHTMTPSLKEFFGLNKYFETFEDKKIEKQKSLEGF